MKPEPQRIAIAEECNPSTGMFRGWYYDPLFNNVVRQNKVEPQYADIAPDYLNDLNAMHEAEKVLNANEYAKYAELLSRVHPTYCTLVLDRHEPREDFYCETFSLIHATAAQRAEAFLRTIGKWEESS